MERKERCETCRFWKRLEVGDLYADEAAVLSSDEVDDQAVVGSCRRLPPVLSSETLEKLGEARMKATGHGNDDNLNYHSVCASRQPVTWDVDWCGEWQPKADAPPPQTP